MKKNLHKLKYRNVIVIFWILSFMCLTVAFPASAHAASSQDKQPAHKDTVWTVTQYGNAGENKQYMFYSIKGTNGKTILVDGGWKSNEDAVRSAIRKLGGRVDLWVITHPHPDHAGAFNAIAANPENIKIGKVCAPKINAGVYKRYAQYWDEYPVFTEFSRLLKNQRKVQWLKAGDSFDFFGLEFQVFHSYYQGLSKKTKDICNDSSLVFKVSGSKKVCCLPAT